jgi:hypothetical protein
MWVRITHLEFRRAFEIQIKPDGVRFNSNFYLPGLVPDLHHRVVYASAIPTHPISLNSDYIWQSYKFLKFEYDYKTKYIFYTNTNTRPVSLPSPSSRLHASSRREQTQLTPLGLAATTSILDRSSIATHQTMLLPRLNTRP